MSQYAPVARDPSSHFWHIGTLLAITLFIRLIISTKYDDFSKEALVLWRFFTIQLSVLAAALWGALAFVTFWKTPLYSMHAFIISILIMGLANVALITLPGYLWVTRLYSLFILIPPILFFFFMAGPEERPVTFIYLIFMVYLFAQTGTLYRNTWMRLLQKNQLMVDREEMQSIINGIPGLVSTLDKDLVYTSVNDRLLEHLKITKENVLGKTFGFMYTNDAYLSFVKNFVASSDMASTKEIQLSIDGEPRWHLIMIERILPQNRAVKESSLLIIGIDIEDQKKIQSKLDEQIVKSQFASKMATLGEMAGGIAHEVNNPLAIVIGKAQQLKRLAETDALTKDAVLTMTQKIEQTADRIAKIVRGLKTFARDGEEDPFLPVSVSALIHDTLELCMSKATQEGIEITAPSLDAELKIQARETQISQVLLNLITNARDAIRDKQKKWIRIEVVADEKMVDIAVVDSGEGIPEHIRDKILLPFFTTKPVGQGTGLGLSITKSIAEAHGGRFYIDASSPNTRFVVRLPRAS